ncbi:chaperonin-containing T-complex member BBS12 [Gastrophryne carolinensis]
MAIRCHVGLMELHKLSSSAKSFLGPFKSYKFIYDQDTQESSLTCSSFRLLENLDLTSSVGQLLNESIHVHHKMYKTGTTTLFFLVGAWSKAVLECVHQGVPISAIVSIMLQGLDSCTEIAASLHIKLDHVHITEENVATYFRGDSCVTMASSNPCSESSMKLPGTSGSHHFNHLPRNRIQKHLGHAGGQTCQMNRLSHSRHFSNGFFHSAGTTFSSRNLTLRDLTKSLSHGNSEVMNLVEKAVIHLCESVEALSVTKDIFQASHLELCFLRGQSEAFSNAFYGYTTLVAAENYEVVRNVKEKPLKILLLDGDLTENYRHLGFNKATNVRLLSGFPSNWENKGNASWIDTTFRKIIQASIDLILLRGDVCPQVSMQCSHKNILIIPRVPRKVLQKFSECTGAELVTYPAQINSRSVGGEVYVNPCTQGSIPLQCSQGMTVNIRARRVNLVTAVLSCRLNCKQKLLEDQFWTCAYRLHHALGDQKLFPGGGAVELLCLSHVRKLGEMVVSSSADSKDPYPSSWISTTAMHYKGYVYNCLAEGFHKYLSVLLCNIGECSSEMQAKTFIQKQLMNINESPSPSSYILNEYFKNAVLVDDQGLASSHTTKVYDNVLPKLEAWRRALHLVLLVLQSDAEIILGSATHKHMVNGDFVTGGTFFL